MECLRLSTSFVDILDVTCAEVNTTAAVLDAIALEVSGNGEEGRKVEE